jgi:hypothetical protein
LGHETPTLDQCSLNHFATLSSPELADFIWRHDPNVLLKKDIPKKKGSVADAVNTIDNDSTADNIRIFTAYMYRDLLNILSSKQTIERTNENFDEASHSKRTHWELQLAYKNLPVVAVYMMLVDHVKSDRSCLDESMSLLTTNVNQFLPWINFPEYESAYLYYDTNLGAFVRSRKLVERGFVVRHYEHENESNKEEASSNFYFLYPSRDVATQTTRRKQGVFQSMHQFIAAGFDPKSEIAASLDKSNCNEGVLIMSNADAENIKKSISNQPCIIEKFHAYLAYLMELGYDLSIQPSVNVSNNPGFESFVGVF